MDIGFPGCCAATDFEATVIIQPEYDPYPVVTCAVSITIPLRLGMWDLVASDLSGASGSIHIDVAYNSVGNNIIRDSRCDPGKTWHTGQLTYPPWDQVAEDGLIYPATSTTSIYLSSLGYCAFVTLALRAYSEDSSVGTIKVTGTWTGP